jgi:hypothetical protein
LVAGRIALQKGDGKAARAHFQHVLYQNPFNPELSLSLAKLDTTEGNAAGAAQFKHFAELALQPRPTRSFTLPPERAGDATVSIIAPKWGHIRVDGEEFATPAWNLAVTGAQHTITYTKADGTPGQLEWTPKSGPNPVLQL